MVDKLALKELFLRVLLFSPATIISPRLRTYLHLRVVLTRERQGITLGIFKKAMFLRKSWSCVKKSTFSFTLCETMENAQNVCHFKRACLVLSHVLPLFTHLVSISFESDTKN